MHLTEVLCPECKTNVKIKNKQIITCPKCQFSARIDNNIISWSEMASVLPQRKSVFQRLYNNGRPLTKLLEIISLLFHPFLGRLSPIGWLVRRNAENYYRRSLYSKKMSDDWLEHYCKGIKLNKNASILDLGCGRGRHIALLRNKGYQLYGQDIYQHPWWQNFKEDTIFQVVPPNKMCLPWESNHFDLVITVMMNGFFDDRSFDNQVREIHRILRPGGHWMLLESNPGASVVQNFISYYGRKPRTKKEALSIIKNTSWSVINQWYERYYAPFFPMAFDAIRTVLAGDSFDIDDYKTTLLNKMPNEKKGLWGLLLKKIE